MPTIPGIRALEEFKTNILKMVRHNLMNTSALVRRAALLLMEYLAGTCVDIDPFIGSQVNLLKLFGFKNVSFPSQPMELQEFRKLLADGTPMVRRQLVLTMDSILNVNRQNVVAINAYITVMLSLAVDDDTKVMETVMDSFKKNIFDNIQPYEKTTSDKHLFPWRLLEAMFSRDDSPNVKGCISNWVNKKLLT